MSVNYGPKRADTPLNQAVFDEFVEDVAFVATLTAGGGPWFDITYFSFGGGAGAAAAVNSVALSRALAAARAAGSGAILVPLGSFAYDAQIDGTAFNGLCIFGLSQAGPAGRTSELVYTGSTANPAINFNNSSFAGCRDISLQYSNPAFVGVLVGITGASLQYLERCLLQGTTTAATGATLVRSNASTEARIVACFLANATYGVLAQDAVAGVASQMLLILATYFGVGIQTADIRNMTQGLVEASSFEALGNVFNPGGAGMGAAFVQDAGVASKCQGLTIRANFMGDANDTVSVWVWISIFGNAVTITGNLIAGPALASNATGIKQQSGVCAGWSITGNWLQSFAKALDVSAATALQLEATSNHNFNNAAFLTGVPSSGRVQSEDNNGYRHFGANRFNALIATAAAVAAAAGEISYGGTVTAGATAGANGAPPAQVAGYILINVAGVAMKIPFYAN